MKNKLKQLAARAWPFVRRSTYTAAVKKHSHQIALMNEAVNIAAKGAEKAVATIQQTLVSERVQMNRDSKAQRQKDIEAVARITERYAKVYISDRHRGTFAFVCGIDEMMLAGVLGDQGQRDSHAIYIVECCIVENVYAFLRAAPTPLAAVLQRDDRRRHRQ